MRRFFNAVSMLALLLIALLLSSYALLRTNWGIPKLLGWISNYSDYHLCLKRVNHNWHHPAIIEIEDLTYGDSTRPAALMAKTVRLRLSWRQLINPMHFAEITIDNATMVLGNLQHPYALPITADRLSFTHLQLLRTRSTPQALVGNLQATLIPWQPTTQHIVGQNFNFRLTGQQIHIAGYQLDQLTVQGSQNAKELDVALSGSALRGQFTATAKRNPQGCWQLDKLQANRLRFQTPHTLPTLLTHWNQSCLTLKEATIQHSTIIGPDWSVTELNLNTENWPANSDWLMAEKGQLQLSAQTITYGAQQLDKPQLQFSASPAGLKLERFSTQWMKGNISGYGHWSRSLQHLVLEQLTIKDLVYPLPTHWKAWLQQETPAAIQKLTFEHLDLQNNLLIDITPGAPFQLTALRGRANDLQLVNQQRWGIWRGDSNWQAAAATFNRQDIRGLRLKLTVEAQQQLRGEFKMLVNQGPVIGHATLSAATPNILSLTAVGQRVPFNFLTEWGWPHPLKGNGDFDLALTGPFNPWDFGQTGFTGRLKIHPAGGSASVLPLRREDAP